MSAGFNVFVTKSQSAHWSLSIGLVWKVIRNQLCILFILRFFLITALFYQECFRCFASLDFQSSQKESIASVLHHRQVFSLINDNQQLLIM